MFSILTQAEIEAFNREHRELLHKFTDNLLQPGTEVNIREYAKNVLLIVRVFGCSGFALVKKFQEEYSGSM